ncbi:MAG: RelE/StbE replicon stabilization toxin [uncultured Sulfurovum sp.]|uniref:RelE/StbE replicon stabilization toxin n=1 Tax=uncultured Sulfurovum sp. TaxID=269237 RepID=A0A6S6S5L4_9BACT|nr:MAG: RelE/StbE replicon stabilization toxin [uncultured Sulfurovum sp.]
MHLVYTLKIDDKVIKDLKKIDKTWQTRILSKIRTTLTTDPYSGKKLVGNLSPFWRIRVGDYRVIYAIEEEIVTVEVVKVKHRKEIS